MRLENSAHHEADERVDDRDESDDQGETDDQALVPLATPSSMIRRTAAGTR